MEMNNSLIERINQLEQQILVHSILYYRLGCSIWTDDKWNNKAKELQALAEAHPEEYKASLLYDDFKGFSWVSGYDLPLYHEGYTAKALWLMNYAKERSDLL